jgi:hypothetical protein
MLRIKGNPWITASLVSSLFCFLPLGLFQLKPAAAQSSDDHVIYIDQGWSMADREMWYQISQGSAVLDYDIFLNLEVAGSQELFRSDANSDLYGLMPQAANRTTNPDALPIGLTKTLVAQGRWKGEYIGLTCAACHTAQLTYRKEDSHRRRRRQYI